MRVCVLTTSYPRYADDVAGRFVEDGVVHLRRSGAEIDVVSPSTFRHYGIAYGDGIANNLRACKWRVLLLPLFFLSFARAARRASRGADVVHAHWLPSGIAGMATRKPLVVQLWGTDAELGKKLPWLFGPILRRARLVVCASSALAADARSLGARDVRVIPSGVDLPESTTEPDDPPHVLYAGRLSEEKGVRDLAEAAKGLPLVVVGDGPLRDLFPDSRGFVPPRELGPYYDRAAVIVVPSLREGYGVVAREAMAHGRPVVGSAVGGLLDVIEDGATGLLVQPRDPSGLRAALERLLGDRGERERLGLAARVYAESSFGWESYVQDLTEAYVDVMR